MTKFRRGFKTEANEIARDIREELGLRRIDPLDPWRLADYLAIPIIPLSHFVRDAPNALKLFMGIEEGAFSAVTVFHGPARVVVHNDAHARVRQASNLAHEISHALLHHPPAPAFDNLGCRNWEEEREHEANWLAGALLISEEAALLIVREKLTLEEAAERYGVSQKMVQFRLNVTGAWNRIRRASAFYKAKRK